MLSSFAACATLGVVVDTGSVYEKKNFRSFLDPFLVG